LSAPAFFSAPEVRDSLRRALDWTKSFYRTEKKLIYRLIEKFLSFFYSKGKNSTFARGRAWAPPHVKQSLGSQKLLNHPANLKNQKSLSWGKSQF
jgi:hypothetical protein